MRPLQLLAAFNCIFGPASQLVRIDNDRSVRIPDIRQRAFGKNVALFPRSGGLQSPFLVFLLYFLNRIVIRNPPKFIETTRWTLPTTLDSALKRNIERCAIHARLSARDQFHLRWARLVASRNDIGAFDH